MLPPLPPTPYDVCDKRTTRVTSLSLVRYRANDYSVKAQFATDIARCCWTGYVDEIVICCGAKRSRATGAVTNAEELIFDPLHGLALLERKTNALDQAAPIGGLGAARTVHVLETFARGTVGKARQARVRAGIAITGGLPIRARCRGGEPSLRVGSDWLGCIQALSAVPHRATAAALGLDEVSAPAGSPGRANLRCGLFGTAGTRRGVMARSKLLLEAHLKALRLPTFLRRVRQTGAAMRRRELGIRGASCNNSASWNCSTVNSGPPSAASRPRSFP